MNRGVKNFLIVAIILSLVVVGGYAALRAFGPTFFPVETTSTSDYGRVLRDWSASGLVAHFPADVPPQASNVKFSAYPGYMQGGGWVQLRLTLPPDEVARIEAGLKPLATHTYNGGGFSAHVKEAGGVPTATFHTADDPKTGYDFPAHYVLYVLQSRDHGNWNQGQTRGVAVSATTNEVVYWAEDW